MKVELECKQCGKKFMKENSEIRRQNKRGKTNFFCCRTCACNYGNSKRDDLRKPIIKICPHCKKEFETKTGSKSNTFCSASCASAGSVTKHRRESMRTSGKNAKNHLTGDIYSIAEILKKREAPKYVEIEKFLKEKNIKHEFEFVLDKYIYDLHIEKYKILIEFDEKYHIKNSKQKVIDENKNKIAEENGYEIKRIIIKKGEKVYSSKEVAFIILNKII